MVSFSDPSVQAIANNIASDELHQCALFLVSVIVLHGITGQDTPRGGVCAPSYIAAQSSAVTYTGRMR